VARVVSVATAAATLAGVAFVASAVVARVVSALIAVAFAPSAAVARIVSVATSAVVANVPAVAGSVKVKSPCCTKIVLNAPGAVENGGIKSNAALMAMNSPRINADRPSDPVPGLPLGL
jgi:hypothetical protein